MEERHLMFFIGIIMSLMIVSCMAAEVAASGGGEKECKVAEVVIRVGVFSGDGELIKFALNLEYLEAEFFLFGALGKGLDSIAPELANGGPSPIGVKKAHLDDRTRRIIEEFGYQEVGHLKDLLGENVWLSEHIFIHIYIYIYIYIFRAIIATLGGFPRPKLDLRAKNFAKIVDDAFGYNLSPPFDPYANTLNYLLPSYIIPYVGLVGYVGANPNLNGYISKRVTNPNSQLQFSLFTYFYCFTFI
ncbi:hypothetical protein DsansV1_C06g0060491 [Dioscorea sansibarensis]